MNFFDYAHFSHVFVCLQCLPKFHFQMRKHYFWKWNFGKHCRHRNKYIAHPTNTFWLTWKLGFQVNQSKPRKPDEISKPSKLSDQGQNMSVPRILIINNNNAYIWYTVYRLSCVLAENRGITGEVTRETFLNSLQSFDNPKVGLGCFRCQPSPTFDIIDPGYPWPSSTPSSIHHSLHYSICQARSAVTANVAKSWHFTTLHSGQEVFLRTKHGSYLIPYRVIGSVCCLWDT